MKVKELLIVSIVVIAMLIVIIVMLVTSLNFYHLYPLSLIVTTIITTLN